MMKTQNRGCVSHTWSRCRGVWSMLQLISVFPVLVLLLCGIQTYEGWTCWPPAEAWLRTVSGWRCSGWRRCNPPHLPPCRTHPVQTDPPSQGSQLRLCCKRWWLWSLSQLPPPSPQSRWRKWRRGQLGMRQSPLSVGEDGLGQRKRREEEVAGALRWLGCLLYGKEGRPWWRSSSQTGDGHAHLRRSCLPQRSPYPLPVRPGTACSQETAGCPYCAALSPLHYVLGGCHPQTPLHYWGCPHLQQLHPSQIRTEERRVEGGQI